MFKNARVGDKVWNLYHGWGVITGVQPRNNYPIKVKFDSCMRDYDMEGYAIKGHLNPSLFWDEVKFEIPEKPLPTLDLDTRVIVWSNAFPEFKYNRYFSSFRKDGKIIVFDGGATSWTAGNQNTTTWDNWKLADEPE